MTESGTPASASAPAGTRAHRPRWEIWLSRIAHAVLILAWLAAFTATHIPPDRLPALGISGKVLHLVGYAGLSSLLWIVLIFRGWPLWRRLVLVLATMPIYSALDELTQPLFHRSCDFDDWLIDCLGMLLSVCLLEIAWRLAKKVFRRPGS